MASRHPPGLPPTSPWTAAFPRGQGLSQTRHPKGLRFLPALSSPHQPLLHAYLQLNRHVLPIDAAGNLPHQNANAVRTEAFAHFLCPYTLSASSAPSTRPEMQWPREGRWPNE